MSNLSILDLENEPKIKEAYDFFAPLREDRTVGNKSDFNGVNKYGMVDFVLMTNKAANIKADGELTDLNTVIESLSNIIIAAVQKLASKDSGSEEEKKENEVDPKYWKQAFIAMSSLFFSSYEVETNNYSETKKGKDVVNTIISIGFNTDSEPEGKLQSAIKLYLSEQGKFMDELDPGSERTNQYTLMNFVNYEKDGKHTCALRAYFTEFTSKTIEISHACSENEKAFDFDFKITRCNADFMLNNWATNPDFRARVNDFITSHIKKDDPTFDDLKTSHKFTVE